MFNSDKVKIVGLTRKMDKLAKRFYILADPKADTSAGLMHDHIVATENPIFMHMHT